MNDTVFRVTHVLDINIVRVRVNNELADKLKDLNFPLDQCIGSDTFLSCVSDLETQDQVDLVLNTLLLALRSFVVERCDSPVIIISSAEHLPQVERDYFENRNQF